MPAINRIAAFHDEMTAWRRDLHAHPELAFEEVRTSGIVAAKLAEWGLEVHRGLAGTGVVGTLKGAKGAGRAIGLRADMDALPMPEQTGLAYASTVSGKMHACGHDGHTTMLLGAARYLAENPNFAGTVHFIFQPAEEVVESGGRQMVEQGLFDRFPCDAVYAVHNMPIIPEGVAAVRGGPVMAAADDVRLTVTGVGGHAAAPHLTLDPVPVAAELILALQRIASRTVDPLDSVVVSLTTIHGGSAFNVIPDTVEITGTVRTLKPETREKAVKEIERICAGLGAAHGVRIDVDYRYGHPATVNNEPQADIAARALSRVLGAEKVVRDMPAIMGGEDFSYMLMQRPGAYAFLGQGGPPNCSLMCHNTGYDFNDAILPVGASFFATVVEEELGRG